MDFSSLPRHPEQPADRKGIGGPTWDLSVVLIRVLQLVGLLVLLAFLGLVGWILSRLMMAGFWLYPWCI